MFKKLRCALGVALATVCLAAAPAFADLRGIDISSWQSSLYVPSVDADFVIVKATQGTWYTNPSYSRHAAQTVSSGKLLGIYHYAEGGSVAAEAEHFIDAAGPYIGEAVLVLDWESQDNPGYWQQGSWVKSWCDYVYQRTGVKPMVYVSASIMGYMANIGDYGLWIAQYASMNATGYQSTPWNEGAYTCAMRQYTASGLVSGYGGYLDLNKFYGNRDAWMKYATGDPNATYDGGGEVQKPSAGSSQKPSKPKPSTSSSKYTVRYGDCLSTIGAKLGVSWTSIASANGIHSPYVIYPGQRLTIPGESQASSSSRTYTVRYGDCLSVIGARLGVSWTTLASRNGISSPYVIYPGQVLRY